MSPIEVILLSVLGSGTLIAILGWLTKSLVTHLLDKDIQRYKAELESEKKVELQKLEFELKRRFEEHSIRFEKLHQRRDEVIAVLYSKIVEFYNAIESFIDFARLPQENELEIEREKLWAAVDSFRDYAEKHRIYFSEAVCSRLDNLYQTADHPTSLLVMASEYKGPPGGSDFLIDAWKAAEEALTVDVQAIRQAIEADFRGLLGVASSIDSAQ